MKSRIASLLWVGIFFGFGTLQADSVWFADTCGTPDADIPITIMAEIDSPGVRAVELYFAFPAESIEYIQHSTQNTFMEGWMVASNDSPPGILNIAGAGTNPVFGNGPLIYIFFHVSPQFTDSFNIDLTGVFETTPFPDTSMSFEICGADVEEGRPSEGKMELRLYPNPFKRSLRIEFQGGLSLHPFVRIFNKSGREIYAALPEKKGGIYEVIWSGEASDGSKVPPGLYLVTVDNGRSHVRPVIFLP